VRLANSSFIANKAERGDGGGIYNQYENTMSLTNGDFIANTAPTGQGGAIYSGFYSTATITSARFVFNVARKGGGLANGYESMLTLTNSEIRANNAISTGGGLYQESFSSEYHHLTTTIIGSRLLGNKAGETGGALQSGGEAYISQSCIVGNSDKAVDYLGYGAIEAGNNWWGASNGPGGAEPGGGDSVHTKVAFKPFLGNPILGCPWRGEYRLFVPHIEAIHSPRLSPQQARADDAAGEQGADKKEQ
jgi:predicted outer membrane repeat protein